MRCYSYNSTYTCNQWKFNTYNAKASCMLTHVIPLNPKDQDLAGHAITKFHLISSLTFQITRTSKKLPFSHFPRVHVNQNSHLIFVSFLLRKELEALLSLLSNPWVNTSIENKAPYNFFFTLSQALYLSYF